MAATNIVVEVADRFATAKYTAPNTSACTVILYSDSGRTVKVPDTDSALFTNSDNDLLRDATAGYNVGRARQFRFGTQPKFGAVVNVNALDGKNYSRTLQVATTYYYTICGTNGQFTTQTIPFGRTLPPARPILANGLWGFPTLDYTNRNKQYVDPSTGAQVQLTNIPRDDTNDLTSKVPSAVGTCLNWNNPANLLANTADATYSATTSDRCLITGNIANSGGSQTYTMDWFKLYVNGSASGVGDDTILESCITLDGVSCSSNIKDIQLTSTSQQLNCYPFGTNAQDCGANPAVINTWTPVISNIAYAQAYNNVNFGVFIWKKGGSNGNITLRNVKFEMGRSYESLGFSIGNQFSCGFTTVTGATGIKYWLCDDPSTGGNPAHRFSLDPLTGTQHFLGRIIVPTTTGIQTNSSNGYITLTNSQQFDHSDSTITYTVKNLCTVSSESSSCASGTNGHTLVKCSTAVSGVSYYDSDAATNANVNFSRGCVLINPLPNSLEVAATAFNAAFDATKFTNWTLDAIQTHYAILHAIRGQQNTYGWQIVVDLNNGNVVAMRHTALGPLYFYEGFHNVVVVDDSSPGWMVTVHHGLTGCVPSNNVGCGPYTTTLNTTLNNTDAPGTNVTISLAGDPAAPFADTTIETYVTGQLLQLGTNACTTADKCEIVQVVTNNGGGSVTVSRGYGVGTNVVVAVIAHNSGDTVTAIGTTGDWLHTNTTARSVYWNFLNDPNGQDLTATNTAISTTDLDGGHEALSQGSVIGSGTSFVRFSDNGGPNGGYGVLTGATMLSMTNQSPTIGVPQAAVFAGRLVNCGAADFQKHPQSPHNIASPIAQRNWGLDALGYQGAGTGDFKLNQSVGISSSPTGATESGNTVTITTTSAHGLAPQQSVTVSGVGVSGYNKTYTILTVPSPTTFTANNATSGLANSGSGSALPVTTQVTTCSNGCPGSLYVFTNTVNFHRKYPGQQMTCGMFPIVDISGPGSVIDGTSTSNYQFCHSNANDECVVGSVPGNLYINCPFTATPTSCLTTTPPASWGLVNAICVADWPLLAESTPQFMLDKNQPNNERTRLLTTNLTPFLQQSIGATATMTPDGAYVWTPVYTKEVTSSELLVKVPPFLFDNLSRNDWIQVPVKLGGKAGATHTIIKFGIDTNLFCTSRQEKCVAASSTWTQSTPFYYETSESGSYTGVDCSTGCTILVPAISGQPLDYQVFYRDGSNVVLGTSNIIETAIQ